MKSSEIESSLDYEQYIDEFVEIFVQEYEENGSNDTHYDISQQIDSDRLIMYNPLKVLTHSSNNPEDPYWKDAVTAMAYDVMRQDVYEKLNEEIEEL